MKKHLTLILFVITLICYNLVVLGSNYTPSAEENLYHYVRHQGGMLDEAKKLIKAGANIHHIYKRKETSLHSAAQDGNTEVLQYLIEQGLNNINDQDGGGYTALHYAILGAGTAGSKESNLEKISFLISKNADITITNGFGEDALHYARSLNIHLMVI